MAENEEGKNFESYKKLCQFWGVLQLIENDDVYNRFLDQEKVNTQLEIVIKKEGDINYQFSKDDIITLCNPELSGCTALHLAVGRKNEILKVLLSRPGIDLTIKNHKGSSALHEVVERHYEHYKGHWQMIGTLENETVDAILAAHIELDVSENPCDKNGLSHFHVACMANNVSAVEFFINKGVSVDQAAVGDFSPILGYTPLHFAVICCALETVEVLLRYGANVNKKDAKGMSPVHLLLEKNMTIVDLIHTVTVATSSWRYWQIPKLMSDIEANKKIMKLLLRHMISFQDRSKFHIGDLSLFHIACTLENTKILEELLTEVTDINHCVKMDSAFWSGYTASHFAAYFDVEILKFLLRHEANIEVKDANGLTPFVICLEMYKVQDLHSIVSSNPVWRDLLVSDNKTRLLDIISAMKDSNTLDDFLKDVGSCQSLRLPNDSPLWPGYTLLHLAVNFTESIKIIADCEDDCTEEYFKKIEREYIARIEICLKYGADLTVQDARGWTALHLAYRLQKGSAVKFLLQEHTQIANPIDEDNLSHFYIACAFNQLRLVKVLLSNDKVDVNLKIKSTMQEWRRNQKYFARRNCKEPQFFVTTGATPLHAAAASGSSELVKILLEHGANVNEKDSNGVTPLHRALAHKDPWSIGPILLSSPNVEEYTFQGLNYLHLAAKFRSDEDVIDKLIKLGADINSAIDYHTKAHEADDNLLCVAVNCERRHLIEPFAFMASNNKYRPIDIAIHCNHKEVVKILLKRGVDIFAARPDGWTVLYGALYGWYCDDLIIATIKSDVTLQQRMQEETGITMLHLACKDCNFDDAECYSEKGVNVNVQVKLDSPLWPGCTPMHILAKQAYNNQDKICSSMRLLLKRGADLTLMDSEKNTPIHIVFTYDLGAHLYFTELLLNGLKNFKVNTTNNQGISHFHIACLRSNLAVTEEFLKCHVDVNQPVALHSDRFPGCSPLHLVLHPHSRVESDVRLEAIDLLIKRGANAHATDLYGNNLFHAVSKCAPPRTQLFEKIFSIGTSIDAKNVFGEEPLGVLLSSKKFEYSEVKFFLNHNCHANLYDPIREEGYLKFLFGGNHPIKKIAKHPSITKIDDFGRNAIHNIVSWEWSCTRSYYQVIPILMDRGCKIDHQDKLGRTPLHYALKFSNSNAVIDLLGAGADINVTDAKGNTPFSDAFFNSKDSQWHPYEYDCNQTFIPMVMHVYKLKITGLYVNDLNSHILEELLEKCSLIDRKKIELANDELTKMKDLKIESTQLSPHDFFSETGVIAAYPYNMSLLEQQAINKFFTSIKKHDFAELGYLLKIRHGKALKRLSLLSPAKVGLDLLMKSALPEKCSTRILRFLSNAEIENVIESVNLTLPHTCCFSLPKNALMNKKLKCI